MAKYHGKLGFARTTQPEPGLFKEPIVEREYYGDVIQLSRRLQTAEKVIDDISLNQEISIVADAFAYENFQDLRYVTYLGKKWKASVVGIQHPRMTISFGGLYNG